MAKIVIPEDLSGKQLYRFLVENKSQLIAQKKSAIKYSDPLNAMPGLMFIDRNGSLKAAGDSIADDATTLMVRSVANACNWCDSQMDVLLDNSSKKSIRERKGLIPHIKDHLHYSDNHVGDVKDVTLEDIPLKKLGVRKDGTTQCIVFTTEIKKAYNEKIFYFYKTGKINQHSIGLQYIKLLLCINDDSEEVEFANWNKYIDLVINKEYVESKGYFWAVPEIRLLENSCVLFGANELTPTLDVKMDTEDQPHTSTEDQPADEKTFDLSEAIKKTTFFN